ncbi:MAG: NAD-dependent epimerase/dehydratase family protein [Thermomicrobiales bacterium]|nr:NAD-dependent epimerase/dehydratase family protein [Thermomicrobiales bacterium]
MSVANTSILVTGGAGFVGSNLVRRLLDDGAARVHVVDNLLSAERCNLPEDARVVFSEGSIASDVVLRSLADDYDVVFHLSTFHGNQNSIHDPIADHENNQLTTIKLFDHLCGFERLRRVVYSGAGCAVADKTFGEAQATGEDAPVSLEMDSPYSISKIMGEFYSVYFHRQHGLPVVRARFQNVYGPGEILGAGRWRGTSATVWRNVTPTFIYKALHGVPLPVENGGVATRDFIYVGDVVDGLIRCALLGHPGDVYNLASGRQTTILSLANLINELTGNVAPLDFRPQRTWDRSGKRFGSTEKAERELGFQASVGLRDGLMRTIAWTRNAMPIINRAMQKHAMHVQLSA